jgi:hypothetical protein
MMVALLLYAYAEGERSSQAIERALHEDVAYRVIAANQTPDHTTIARFRQRHEQALAGLFGQVLSLCATAGIATPAVLAVDSTKLHANASRDATRSYEQLAKEILEEADQVDAEEEERFGERRGDELPPSLRPAKAAAPGCARPSASSTSSARRRQGRCRRRDRNGSRKLSAGSRRSSRPSSIAPTSATRPTGRAAS